MMSTAYSNISKIAIDRHYKNDLGKFILIIVVYLTPDYKAVEHKDDQSNKRRNQNHSTYTSIA